jgi:hypothetical protein
MLWITFSASKAVISVKIGKLLSNINGGQISKMIIIGTRIKSHHYKLQRQRYKNVQRHQ